MTEVFICALSTTRIELNDQQLQFYLEQKNKEIIDVRHSLDYLHQFSSYSKKQRAQANLPFVWKSLLILAKILGFQQDFLKIDRLKLPETILMHNLFAGSNLFVKKSYRPRQLISRWENQSDHYIILLSGVLEKEITRTSISADKFENLSKTDSFRFKRNQRKRFTRTSDQIPICLNSKRSELRFGQVNTEYFRSITSTVTLEIQMSFWKKYVQDFKSMEEDFIMNFIRKSLAINLNILPTPLNITQSNNVPHQSSGQQKQSEEITPSKLYYIESYQKRTVIQLTNEDILLLYMGQMLVSSPHYKIQTSKGCVLNSGVYICLKDISNQKIVIGLATAKTQCMIIKLDFHSLITYLQSQPDDNRCLQKFLQNLQRNRRSKKEDDQENNQLIKHKSIQRDSKYANLSSNNEVVTLSSHKQADNLRSSSLRNQRNMMFHLKTKKDKLGHKGLSKLRFKTEEAEKKKDVSKRIFECKQIQNIVEKVQRAAELKKNEYVRRTYRTQMSNQGFDSPRNYQDESTLDNNMVMSLFKDSMSCIQTKSDLLKKIVMENRRNKKPQVNTHEVSLVNQQKRVQRVSRDTSVRFLKRKVKQIYLRTSQNEEILPYIDVLTQRQKYQREIAQRTARKTEFVDVFTRDNNYTDFHVNYALELPVKRGVMKKVQKGQIRRIKVR